VGEIVTTHQKPLRIGIIAGETSGAIIALGMLKEIQKHHPDCIIEGIGSADMVALGMKSLFDMNELSVMGLVEVLKHLPRLLHIRKTVVTYFLKTPPDIFIGVDAPDFNLRVETALKQAGIPTVHYVSPTVWAWREKRIHKIAKATNLVLGVFPFEKQIYEKYGLPYEYVGHTMAESVPFDVDKIAAREILAKRDEGNAEFLASSSEILAMLPGSSIAVTRAPARDVMIASDTVLLASGTAALEAMLCKRPMVVAYIMSGLTYFMMKRMYKPKYFALPNILAGKRLVPEFLQEEVNPDNLAYHLRQVSHLSDDSKESLLDAFLEIHKTLACGADKMSAKAVLTLIDRYPR
jgi:lipid-A-disaccharide synthase